MRVVKNNDIFDIFVEVDGVECHYTHPVEINDCSAQAFPPQTIQLTKELMENILNNPESKSILLASNLVNKIS